ncbi:S-methyl-5-thioribose-1-phosphate isomerase [Candidatus Allofournierella excrementigallinarum]|uniref:S-methyl-5-thioribose-1-phosphate isomerase n=1 Tax=Candidatus Allofournierella excrementigallinarum TaxID=2838592 RepID=UPI00374EEF59
MSVVDDVVSVRLDDEKNALIILDQTLLPGETKYLTLTTQQQIWDAIYRLQVRGAPAIGIAAAYGVYLAAKESSATEWTALHAEFTEARKFLASARPTAVNLFWALDRMQRCLDDCEGQPVDRCKAALLAEAHAIREEDEQVCKTIGENALALLRPGMGLLTHCNAGTIATAKYGTALAPIYLGQDRGYGFHVFADETRPLLQGARLTAWELHQAGVDVTLLCDDMCSIVMKNGWVDACLVGCDRVAANGDTANKIGTSTLSIVARRYGVPFYVCAPTSTIDMNCTSGNDIQIELRQGSEISTLWYKTPQAPAGIKAYNPAFDVTDNEFITAIITEKGVVYPPFERGLAEIMK